MVESEKLTPAFPFQVDWRRVLCQSFSLNHQENDQAILESLQNITDRLEAADRSLYDASIMDASADLNYQTMHRIRCAEQSTTELCLNEPLPVWNADGLIHLRGSRVVTNLELHLERNKGTAFLVYRDYKCCESRGPETVQRQPSTISADAVPSLLVNESVSIVSETLSLALDELLSIRVGSTLHPGFNPLMEFSAPYVWWFCQRDRIQSGIQSLAPAHLPHILLFQDYLEESLGQEYQTVDKLLEEGRLSAKYLPYLYIPGEMQLSKMGKDDPQFYRAFKATSWLQYSNMGASPSRLVVSGSSWSYNGFFQQNTEEWAFYCKSPRDETFNIDDLAVFPLRLAGPEVAEALQHRGEMFWECRLPKYICYHNDSALRAQSPQDARYMIDYNTYKDMHPSPPAQVAPRDDLGPEATGPNAPLPDSDFLLCLPCTIPGYHMLKKEWFTLYVSRMTPVQWNVDAFERLVVDDKKKKLIQALVTTQIAAEESTDLMSGKGNGLFILLHGGPGTGKTLTAESVAEIAERPLYRVTCGDVGTKAEEVERYLETVLLLGKTWGCVVLLDEADVFLMQRSVEDFKRNALVSVFLRVLEYYDGILVLTSNRVGTFDAAFKSRIQLSLHYPPLTKENRLQIWKNFIEHVEGLTNSRTASLGIRSREIKDKLPELAKKALNGREIRNAVSTARQLAMFGNEAMGYRHLETVISEMEKFDEYATELKGGLSDDVIARQCQEY